MIFESQSEALFYIFLYGFWLVLLFMTITIRSARGNTIGILNLLQLTFSLVAGVNFYSYSPMISIATIGAGITVFAGYGFLER